MNQQRQKAYLQLIQNLLISPSGQEPEILVTNQQLLDAGFLETLGAVAQMFSQQRDDNTVNWLQSLAMQLREVLNLDNQVNSPSFSLQEIQVYFQFLMEILQATADSSSDFRVVYPLLAKNTDKLDRMFTHIFLQWGIKRLSELKKDAGESVAAVIVEFSNLIAQFPLGRKANNMEIAITGYEVVLQV